MAHKEMRGLEYLVYSALSLCLLIVMAFLPLAPAFADEVEVPDGSADDQSVSVQVSNIQESAEQETADASTGENEISPQPDNEIIPSESDAQNEMQNEILPVDDVSEEHGLVDEEDGLLQDMTLQTADEVSPGDVGVMDDTNSATSVDALAEEERTPNEVVDPQNEEDELINEVVDDVEIPESEMLEDDEDTEEVDEVSADEEIGEVVTVNAVSDDTNKFSFSKDECTTVGDGTFYCTQATARVEVAYTDRIFAAKDVEGDKEIYVEKDGLLVQISNNQYDDDAPYYDEVSNTAVWHRLINGRYQIVTYDFDTEEETELTNDRYNNMQPNRYGSAIVWQGWVGSDWEIFLEQEGNVKMITDNTTHDITPSVNGTHIVWQSFENNVWQMKVYDMRSGAIDTIENADGGSIENPRFVLVYDTKFESGDIETRGYDLKSGEVVHLSAEPVHLPEELPDPDQTGEERALVSTVTQLKPKTENDGDDSSGGATGGEPEPEDGVIVVDSFVSDDQSASTTDTIVNAIEIDIPSITIPAFETSSPTTTEHIDDVVVTPYIEEIATTTLPQ